MGRRMLVGKRLRRLRAEIEEVYIELLEEEDEY